MSACAALTALGTSMRVPHLRCLALSQVIEAHQSGAEAPASSTVRGARASGRVTSPDSNPAILRTKRTDLLLDEGRSVGQTLYSVVRVETTLDATRMVAPRRIRPEVALKSEPRVPLLEGGEAPPASSRLAFAPSNTGAPSIWCTVSGVPRRAPFDTRLGAAAPLQRGRCGLAVTVAICTRRTGGPHLGIRSNITRVSARGPPRFQHPASGGETYPSP